VTWTFRGPYLCDWTEAFQVHGWTPNVHLHVSITNIGTGCDTGGWGNTKSSVWLCDVNATGSCTRSFSYPLTCCTGDQVLRGSHQYTITDDTGEKVIVSANNG
jgi:hypothetical protein